MSNNSKNAWTLQNHLLDKTRDWFTLHNWQAGSGWRTYPPKAILEHAYGSANYLMDNECRAKETVLFVLPSGVELVTAFLGAVLAGCIPVILPDTDEKLGKDRFKDKISNIVKQTQAKRIFTAPGCRRMEGLPVEQIYWKSLRKDGFKPSCRSKGSDTVLIQFSSGTTGSQKGMPITNDNIRHQLFTYADAIKIKPDDKIVSWLPFYHDMGLVGAYLLAVVHSVALCLISPFDWIKRPVLLWEAVAKFQATLCWLPNFAYNFLANPKRLAENNLQDLELSSVRMLVNCSERVRPESHERFHKRFRGKGVKQEFLAACYAMAENTFCVSQTSPGRPASIIKVLKEDYYKGGSIVVSKKPGSADFLSFVSSGKPIRGTQVKIISSGAQELGEDKLGEIAVKGKSLFPGYLNQTRSETFDKQGYFHTGDLGFIHKGELYVTGRKKEIIIVGGRNIFPQDIEAEAEKCRGVRPGRVAAFGVENDREGTEDLVVVAEKEGLSEKSGSDLMIEIKKTVFKNTGIPVQLARIVDEGWIVKTSSGKIERASCREKFLKEAEA